MSSQRFTLFLLIFFLIISGSVTTSCKSRTWQCEANYQNQSKKQKKNKNRYGVKYGYKANPTRKAYVIRNKN